MKVNMLALVVLLGIFGRVDATYFVNAGAVLSACESESVDKQNKCVSYLGGIADATSTWIDWGMMSQKFCQPDEVSLEQLRRIYIKYATEHPEDLHLTAAGVALNAFVEAFPCE